MTDYQVPAAETRVEIIVVNSRFIATLAPVFDVQAARKFIKRIRAEFPDATHHVPAYVVGHGASVVAHCSDDGEPSGTAGRPALAVLQGSGLGDAAVVVTRYFGGTKLGTGGLVKAYGDAVRKVILKTPRARKVPTHTAMVNIPYGLFERVRLMITSYKGEVVDQEFGTDVTLTVQFATEDYPDFEAQIQELSAGKIQPVLITTENRLHPI
jgi:uncharacterized YigZ family protein